MTTECALASLNLTPSDDGTSWVVSTGVGSVRTVADYCFGKSISAARAAE